MASSNENMNDGTKPPDVAAILAAMGGAGGPAGTPLPPRAHGERLLRSLENGFFRSFFCFQYTVYKTVTHYQDSIAHT